MHACSEYTVPCRLSLRSPRLQLLMIQQSQHTSVNSSHVIHFGKTSAVNSKFVSVIIAQPLTAPTVVQIMCVCYTVFVPWLLGIWQKNLPSVIALIEPQTRACWELCIATALLKLPSMAVHVSLLFTIACSRAPSHVIAHGAAKWYIANYPKSNSLHTADPTL